MFQFSGTMFFGKFVFFQLLGMMIHHFDASKNDRKSESPALYQIHLSIGSLFFSSFDGCFSSSLSDPTGATSSKRGAETKQTAGLVKLRVVESWGMLTEEGQKTGKTKDVNLVTQDVIVARFRLGFRLCWDSRTSNCCMSSWWWRGSILRFRVEGPR